MLLKSSRPWPIEHASGPSSRLHRRLCMLGFVLLLCCAMPALSMAGKPPSRVSGTTSTSAKDAHATKAAKLLKAKGQRRLAQSKKAPPQNNDVDLDRYDRRDDRGRGYRRYRRGRPAYYRTHNSRRGFLIAGIVLTSVSYGLSLFVGLTGYSIAAAAKDGTTALDFGMLMLPVAGPFVTWGLLAGRHAANPSTYSLAPVAYPWLAILGLSQGLGVAFIIVGATGKRRRVPVYGSMPQTQRHTVATIETPPPTPHSAQAVKLGSFGH